MATDSLPAQGTPVASPSIPPSMGRVPAGGVEEEKAPFPPTVAAASTPSPTLNMFEEVSQFLQQAATAMGTPLPAHVNRSEEHTSELQSPRASRMPSSA